MAADAVPAGRGDGGDGQKLCLAHFFAATRDPALYGAPELPAMRCLLAGPPGCGKTTLLFNYAVNAASRGLRCVLLTGREAVELNPPLLAPESAPAGTLNRIDMKYLHGEEELVKWCASLHLVTALPHCILLDGLTSLLDAPGPRDGHGAAGLAPREVRLARCLALLTDATQFAASRAAAGTPPRGCQLIISDRSADGGDSPPLWFVWRRWTPLVLTCRSCGPSFQLGVLPTDTGPQCRTALRYSRTATALVAEGLVRPGQATDG